MCLTEYQKAISRFGCRVEEIRQEHIDELRQYARRTSFSSDIDAIVAVNQQLGPSGAIYYGDQLLAIVGIVKFMPGVAEVWTVINDDIKHKYKRQLLISVKTVLDIAEISLSLHRVQVLIESQADFVNSWPRALGFECEGRLRAYGADRSDYLMFGRVNHGY